MIVEKIFTFLGIIVVLITIHEIGHVIDYHLRDGNYTTTEFCGFGFTESAAGWVGGGWTVHTSNGLVTYEPTKEDAWKGEIFPNVLLLIVGLLIVAYYLRNYKKEIKELDKEFEEFVKKNKR